MFDHELAMMLGRTVEEMHQSLTSEQYVRWSAFRNIRLKTKSDLSKRKPPQTLMDWWN